MLRVWLASTRASVVREMEFRANFVMGIIRQMLWLGVFIFMTDVIFRNVQTLAGWSQPEALIIIALSRIIEGLMNTLFTANIMELPERVRRGDFDWHLIRPLPTLFYTSFRRTSIENIGNLLGGFGLLLYALHQLTTSVSIINILSLLVLAVSGITIYYAILIIVSTLVFVLDRLEFLWGFNVLLSEPLTVPFDIFPRAPRAVLTYLIPLAFIVFVPAQAITGRLASWHIALSLVFAVVFLMLAHLAWKAGLRRYSSASS
jgi:ABC-2 type transport system permease protein